MKEEIPDDLLRRYLQGKLSPAEQEQLKKSLADDPELAEALALQRAEIAVAELLIAAESREWFEEWSKPGNSFLANIRLGWLLAIVAAIGLVVAAIWYFNRPTDTLEKPAPPTETPAPVPAPNTAPSRPIEQPKSQKPIASKPSAPNYRELAALNTEDPILQFRRFPNSSSTASAFSQAQSAFAAGEFQQTLDLLAQPDSARIQSATFLKAHALFRLERFVEAETQFSYLIDLNSRQYRYPSEWGLLMCRLAQLPERGPEVRQQLRDILANSDHPYFERVKRLEQALKLPSSILLKE